jgi:ribosomal protein S27E
MATLLNCTECGHIVSSSADKCPQCKTYAFRGIPCFHCGVMTSSKQRRSSFILDWEDEKRAKFFCCSCWERLEKIASAARPPDTVLTCQACGNQKVIDHVSHNFIAERCKSGKYKEVCQECGHSNEIYLEAHAVSDCRVCGKLLNTKLEKRVELPGNAHTRVSNTIYKSGFVHTICYTDAVDADVQKLMQISHENKRKETVRAKRLHEKQRPSRITDAYYNYVLLAMIVGAFVGWLSMGGGGIVLGAIMGNILLWVTTRFVD